MLANDVTIVSLVPTKVAGEIRAEKKTGMTEEKRGDVHGRREL